MTTKGATRLGDLGSCNKCGTPLTPATGGSPNVFINALPAMRAGDSYAAGFCSVCLTIIPVRKLAAGSSSVFINGLPAGRIGDSLEGGGVVIGGSNNVFIGDQVPAHVINSLPTIKVPKRPTMELSGDKTKTPALNLATNIKSNQETTNVGTTSASGFEVVDNISKTENKTENIIIIGSEFSYNSFWWQMMFMACGYAVARAAIIPPGYSSDVNLTSMLVVSYGYSELELQRIKDGIAALPHIKLVLLEKQAQLDDFLLTREKNGYLYKINNIVVFSHGMPFKIDLNYKHNENLIINNDLIDKLNSYMFADSAIFFSYACRTGAGTTKSDAINPKADASLAQYIADKLNITVKAFYRRTLYSYVLREPSISTEIAKVVKKERNLFKLQETIDISAEHEALLHHGLGDELLDYLKVAIFKGEVSEGVSSYALWRKHGALELPINGSTPSKFPSDFVTFKPKL